MRNGRRRKEGGKEEERREGKGEEEGWKGGREEGRAYREVVAEDRGVTGGALALGGAVLFQDPLL